MAMAMETDEVGGAGEMDGLEEGQEDSDSDSEDSDDSIDSDLEFDGGKWKTYNAGSRKNKEPFEEWLSKYTPSSVLKKDGYAWISANAERAFKDRSYVPDIRGLMESWERFQSSGRPVNYANIKELACNHNVLTGKWLFFCTSGGKVDHLWSLVARGIVGNSWPCVSAKVSCYEDSGQHSARHVVCIYNEDFTNVDHVMLAEQAIRNMGLKCELLYKPDVYTWLGVYSQNPWKLNPIIRKSVFDLKTGKSKIESFVPD